MKKVLITGASGFIGKQVQKSLLEAKFEIYPTSRHPREGYLLLDAFNQDQSLCLLEEISPDTLLNLSWHTSGIDYSTSSQNEDALNWNTSLFEIISQSSIGQVISVGSSAEGRFEQYAETKERAHNNFVEKFARTDKRATWLKIFQVYGPDQIQTRFIPSLFSHIQKRSVFSLHHPSAIRDWIDVRDVAEAIRFIIDDSVESEFEIGTSKGVSNKEICQFLQEEFGLRWEIPDTAPIDEDDDLVASSDSPLFKYFQPQRKLFDYLKNNNS